MAQAYRLFWTAAATGQFLELPLPVQDRLGRCAGLITEFPRIGTRIRVEGEHRRRFLCGEHWIVYRLNNIHGDAAGSPSGEGQAKGAATEPMEITIKYIRKNTPPTATQ